MSRLSCLVALCALVSPALSQQTWIVDDDLSADFSNLQVAVNTASDGDTLLVRGGTYGAIVIDGKGLVIQGEQGVIISVFGLFEPATPSIIVRNTSLDQEVQIRGFETFTPNVIELENIVLDQCAGPVLFEDCNFSQSGGEAVVIAACDSATFVSCDLFADQTFASTAGQFFLAHVYYPGIVAQESNLFLYDCEVRGSNGPDSSSAIFLGPDIPPAPGGVGLILNSSNLLASGCTITGGVGGSDTDAQCENGQDGEAGLEINGSATFGFSTARLLDTVTTGGTGGTGGCGLPDGSDAPGIVMTAGNSVIQHAGTARSFNPSSPAPAGGILSLDFQGEPGDQTYIYLSLGLQPAQQLVPLALALHVELPVTVLSFGTLSASGQLLVDLPVPPLPGYQLYVGQAVFIAQNGGLFESGPRTVLVTP